MKKNAFVVNTATCDMRNITREILEAYRSVEVNAAFILVTPEVQAMLAEYEVKLDCAEVLTVEKELEFVQQNGVYHIKAGDRVPQRRLYLQVNGQVVIEAGTEAVLGQYAGMQVNGQVFCPRSLLTALPQMKVNGQTNSYPDGAVILKNRFVPDRVFALRAKKQDYFVPGKVIFTDESLEYEKLAEIGVHFIVPKALVTETILSKVLPLLEDTTEVTVMDAGMRFVNDDLTLTADSLKKYGSRLYVDGDVTLEDAEAIRQLEKLTVNGELCLREELMDVFAEKGDGMQYRELKILRGTCIRNKVFFQVTRDFLEKYSGPVTVSDVAKLEIAPDVTTEQIETRLSICDCAVVSCSEAQRGAVELVSEDVAKVCTGEDAADGPQEQSGVQVVNASSYTF